MKKKTTAFYAHYLDLKSQAADSVLLVAMGDFYEAFNEDALLINREFGATLGSRNMHMRYYSDERAPLVALSKTRPARAHKDNPFTVSCPFVEDTIKALVAKGHKVAVATFSESDIMIDGITQRVITRRYAPKPAPYALLIADVAREYGEEIPSLAMVLEYVSEAISHSCPLSWAWDALGMLHTIFPHHAETIAEKWLDAHMDSVLQALVDDVDSALNEPYGSPLEVSACQSYIKRHHMPQWCFGMLIDLYSYHS